VHEADSLGHGDAELRVAEQTLRRAHARHPEDYHLNQLLAHILAAGEPKPARPREALGFASAAVSRQPTSLVSWLLVGWVHFELGDHRSAAHAFGRAASLEPTDGTLLLGHANMLRLSGQLEAALDALTKVLHIDPAAHEDVFILRRLILSMLGRPTSEFVRLGQAALDAAPDNPDRHFELAIDHEYAGDSAGAVRHYRAAIQLRDDRSWYHLCLGYALEGLREFEAALASYQKVREIEPAHAASLAAHVDRCKRMQRLRARLDITPLEWPEDPADRLALANLLRIARRFDESAHGFALVAADFPQLVDGNTWYRVSAIFADAQATESTPETRARVLRRLQRQLAELRATHRRYESLSFDDWLHSSRRHYDSCLKPLQWPHLAKLRDPVHLDRLPQAERDEWTRLWTEWRALRARMLEAH
jgi:tetratricopeptide (TPR) repeat protein